MNRAEFVKTLQQYVDARVREQVAFEQAQELEARLLSLYDTPKEEGHEETPGV